MAPNWDQTDDMVHNENNTRAGSEGRAAPRRRPEGAADPLLSQHALYRALGATAAERRRGYRALFHAALDPDFVGALRRATNGGWPLGSDRFKRRLAKALARRVTPREAGRPPKQGGDLRRMKLL